MTVAAGPATGIRIAVSACLLGEEVRYDGGHRRSLAVTESLGGAFRLISECPEVGIGLGVPRPRIRIEIEDAGESVRLLGPRGRDLTAAMDSYSEAAAARLREAGVSGIVLKSRSPSCGMGDVPLHRGGRVVAENGWGRFAGALARALPGPPRISEADLEDPARRDHWLTRVFGFAALSSLVRDLHREGAPALRCREGSGLADFHARWRMTLMAHSEAAVRRLDRQLADGEAEAEDARAFAGAFLAGLAEPPSVESHHRVLRELGKRVRGRMEPGDCERLSAEIAAFRDRRVALAVPARTLARAARRFGIQSLRTDAYLEARPASLAYREAVCLQ